MTLISYPQCPTCKKVHRKTRQKRAIEAVLRDYDNPLTPLEIQALA